MTITMTHKTTGLKKELKVGFSWTQFFFGALVYAFRGMWSEFAKCFFLHAITLGIYNLVQCWTCNKKTVIFYMERGYVPANERAENVLRLNNII